MGRYVEKHLYESELIVCKARRNPWPIVGWWIFGILCCWMLLIPSILAIVHTVQYSHTELVLTNKRLIRKWGVFHTQSIDSPLDKIISVSVDSKFWGRIFNVHTIFVTTETGGLMDRIQRGNEFKGMILGQVDRLEEARLALQASWTAQATVRAQEQMKARRQMEMSPMSRRERRDMQRDAYDDYGYDL